MPQQERQEAVRTNPEILSKQSFVKCRDPFRLSDLQDTVNVTPVHLGLKKKLEL